MRKPLLRIYNYIGRRYLSPILRAEQKKRPFPEINERATEYAFALKHLRDHCDGRVLDIGPGRSSWPHLLSICGYEVKAIDRKEGYWNGYTNRHYHVEKDDITNPQITGPFQFITCISTLEHIEDHRAAMRAMSRLLKTGGYLILTFPYNERSYGRAAIRPFTQIFSRRQVTLWCRDSPGMEVVSQEYYKAFTGRTWVKGKRLIPPAITGRMMEHDLTCILMRKEKIEYPHSDKDTDTPGSRLTPGKME